MSQTTNPDALRAESLLKMLGLDVTPERVDYVVKFAIYTRQDERIRHAAERKRNGNN